MTLSHSSARAVPGSPPAVDGPAAAAAGESDLGEFELVYERYFLRVYRYCLRRVRSPQEAEDLTSTIFARALAHRRDYRGGSAAAWLFRIAHNTVVNHVSRPRPVSLDALGDTAPAPAAGAAPDVLDQIVQQEDRVRLRALLAALPPQEQEILALKLTARLSAREIGQVVGKSEGAVRAAVYRVVQRLRQAWAAGEEGSRE